MRSVPVWDKLNRILNPFQRWLAKRPGWIVVVLAILGLVMGLSPLNPAGLAVLDEVIEKFAGQGRLYALPTREFQERFPPSAANSIRKDEIGGLAIQWQQNARAVHHHGSVLKRVIVLP